MWDEIYKQILNIKNDWGSDILFYRGHSDANWGLLPGLGRIKKKNISELEAIAYYDFITRAGSLIPENNSSWNNILSMQHHGVPTRFLDWTENFSVALYFALQNAESAACVWVLDPFALNKESLNDNTLLHPSDFDGDYASIFLTNSKKLNGDVAAIWPLRHHPRVFQQKSGFTLHNNLEKPLEILHPSVVRKILIPKLAFEGAREYLHLAGISEFSLFPDLDGLAREIKRDDFNL